MKQLIVNADDFGYARGVNEGIVRAHREGIVTSATLMAGAAEFDHAAELSKLAPTLDVGCHLVLVSGRAVSKPDEIPSLASETGELPRTIRQFASLLFRGRIRDSDLRVEIAAQLQKIRNAGIHISHIDSHKHTHMFSRVARIAMETARDFGICCIRNPAENYDGFFPSLRAVEPNRGMFVRQALQGICCRWLARKSRSYRLRFGLRAPDYFYSVALAGLLSPRVLTILIGRLRGGVSELMCHPAVMERTLASSPTRLKQERIREFEAVTSQDVKAAIAQAGVTLIGYRALAAGRM